MPKPHSYDCSRCADSGIIAIRISTGSYAGPGPLPDDTPGYVEAACPCGDNWFQQNHDSDKAFALRNGGQRED